MFACAGKAGLITAPFYAMIVFAKSRFLAMSRFPVDYVSSWSNIRYGNSSSYMSSVCTGKRRRRKGGKLKSGVQVEHFLAFDNRFNYRIIRAL